MERKLAPSQQIPDAVQAGLSPPRDFNRSPWSHAGCHDRDDQGYKKAFITRIIRDIQEDVLTPWGHSRGETDSAEAHEPCAVARSAWIL
jgi:hypothetical protein